MVAIFNSKYTSFYDWVIPTADNALSIFRGAYFHELGHAIAMKLLYQNVKPHIHLNLQGGTTSGFLTSGREVVLTPIGNLLGSDRSSAIVSAAGPIVDVITDFALGALSIAVKASSFPLFIACKVAQVFCIYANSSYALGAALSHHNGTGDYSKIRDYTNISPYIPASALFIRLGYVITRIFI